MTRIYVRSLFVAVTIALALVESTAPAQSRFAESVAITIRPNCTVTSDVVLVSDVARVETRDRALRSHIESLDIADAPIRGESVTVSPSLIEYRLRLAGIDVRRVAIEGDRSHVVTAAWSELLPAARRKVENVRRNELALATDKQSKPVSSSQVQIDREPQSHATTSYKRTDGSSLEDCVVNEAKRSIVQNLPWDDQDIAIKLVQPVTKDTRQLGSVEVAKISADLRTQGAPVGRVQVDVTVEGTDRSSTVIPVTFDVRHFDNVVAASKPIPRGREIQLDDLYVHRWDVTGSADYTTNPQALVGKAARRPISALQIIRDQDTEVSTSKPGQGPAVIRKQDRVKLLAKIGGLVITVNGEAQQDGRVGEVIRVQNVESKAIVQGRVLRANEVEITD